MKSRDLQDLQDDFNQFNAAMNCLVALLAGCSDDDAPPINYLWQLLELVANRGEVLGERLKAAVNA